MAELSGIVFHNINNPDPSTELGPTNTKLVTVPKTKQRKQEVKGRLSAKTLEGTKLHEEASVILPESSSGKGKGKRVRKKDVVEQSVPKQKKAKIAKKECKGPLTKQIPVSAKKSEAYQLKESISSGILLWKVVHPSVAPIEPKATSVISNKDSQSVDSPTPRVWASNKEALLSVLPQLSGPRMVNGISWLMSETPIILLEQGANIRVSPCTDMAGNVLIDLDLARDFVCSRDVVDIQHAEEHHEGYHQHSQQTLLFGHNMDMDMDMDSSQPGSSFQVSETNTIMENKHSIPYTSAELGDADKMISASSVDSPQTFRQFVERADNILDDVESQNCAGACTRVRYKPSCQSCNKDGPYSHPPEFPAPGYLPPPYIAMTTISTREPTPEPPLSAQCIHNDVYIVDNSFQPLNNPVTFHAPRTLPLCPATPPSVDLEDCSSEHCLPSDKIYVSTLEVDRPVMLPRINAVGEIMDLSGDQPNRKETVLPVSSAGPSLKALSDRVPSPLPAEVQALVNAYVQNVPIVIIVSRASVIKNWGLNSLPEEYAFMYMGFFRVLALWENSDGQYKPLDGKPGLISGRITWRFRLEWTGGGEEIFTSSDASESLSRPWWRPQDSTGQNETPNLESAPQYLSLRKSNINYTYMDQPVKDIYQSIIPLQILAPFGPDLSDEAFPRGWLCGDCGKINVQTFLRHRQCDSLSCKHKPTKVGYSLELESIRDPQQALPMILPNDTHAPDVDAKMAIWDDGMRTAVYTVDHSCAVVLKHIFTCNLASLQTTATTLLQSLQSNIQLKRSTGDANPYFTWTASDSQPLPAVNWAQAPGCATDARNHLLSSSSFYGEPEVKGLSVSHLTCLAWVTSGSRRGPERLRAKEGNILIMCLGCEVVLTIFPMSKLPATASKVSIPDLGTLIPFETGELEEEGDITMADGNQIEAEKANSMPITQKKVSFNKMAKDMLIVTLVHGDILMLSGDDFEYSIRRTGTSILLLGSP